MGPRGFTPIWGGRGGKRLCFTIGGRGETGRGSISNLSGGKVATSASAREAAPARGGKGVAEKAGIEVALRGQEKRGRHWKKLIHRVESVRRTSGRKGNYVDAGR